MHVAACGSGCAGNYTKKCCDSLKLTLDAMIDAIPCIIIMYYSSKVQQNLEEQ